ncbi:hypothetical protein EYF80_039625 [Liparis tanakae]|uniref:Uncharacterized protein n=1 Tax=Liparis tanakae TaxID=230148 RepID=A0A4Z2GAF6_9TELE|nr:hypothetical protein EYF80_039625 [Liparis tanakae]
MYLSTDMAQMMLSPAREKKSKVNPKYWHSGSSPGHEPFTCLFSASQAGSRPRYCSKSGCSAAARSCRARAATDAWKEAESTLPRDSSWMLSS